MNNGPATECTFSGQMRDIRERDPYKGLQAFEAITRRFRPFPGGPAKTDVMRFEALMGLFGLSGVMHGRERL